MKALRNKKYARLIQKQWAANLDATKEIIQIMISDSPRSFDSEVDSAHCLDFQDGKFKPHKRNPGCLSPSNTTLQKKDEFDKALTTTQDSIQELYTRKPSKTNIPPETQPPPKITKLGSESKAQRSRSRSSSRDS
jgi:hypothetical protein